MMTHNRAKQIIASYGGQAEHWPEAERDGLKSLVAGSSELQTLQYQALQLDERLTAVFASQKPEATDALMERILGALPEQTAAGRKRINLVTTLADWLTFGNRTLAWSGGVMASVIVALLVATQIKQPSPDMTSATTIAMEDEWSMMSEVLVEPDDMELLAVLVPELSDERDII